MPHGGKYPSFYYLWKKLIIFKIHKIEILSFNPRKTLLTTHWCILLNWHRLSDNHIKLSNELHFAQKHTHTHMNEHSSWRSSKQLRQATFWLAESTPRDDSREVKITKHHDWLMMRTLTQWMIGDWFVIKKEVCLHSDAVVYWQDWSLRLGPGSPYLSLAFYWHSERQYRSYKICYVFHLCLVYM